MALPYPVRSAPPARAPLGERFGGPNTVGRGARWIAGSLSLVAGAIHFAFAPDHMFEDWRPGWFFLALGWFQLVWAVVVITKPSRTALLAGIAASAGTMTVWAFSRTVGLPASFGVVGVEPVGLADELSTILEGLIILLSLMLLASPGWAAQKVHLPRTSLALTSGMVAVALVAGSLSLTPRYNEHQHSHALGPYKAGQSPCEKAAKKYPGNSGEDANPKAGHNHHGALAQLPIDSATRQELAAQQALAQTAVTRYPTVADALKAGYHMSTVYLPCIGAHYTNVSLVGSFNPATPSELLYDGTDPGSKILGLSYLLVHPGGAPDGFAGPNDVWHQHSQNGGLCLNPAGVVIGSEAMSQKTCESRGGRKSGLKDIWMVHDWVAPGWSCSWGVFAAECPELGGRPGGTSASPTT